MNVAAPRRIVQNEYVAPVIADQLPLTALENTWRHKSECANLSFVFYYCVCVVRFEV